MALDSEQRPWGSWHVLDEGDGYKVKRIEVDPGKRLSYQTHAHRAEHWYVIRGTATCTLNDERVVAGVGESVEVRLGDRHRIGNEHDELLVVIEIQRGDYLGEDDIVRLQDDYGRDA